MRLISALVSVVVAVCFQTQELSYDAQTVTKRNPSMMRESGYCILLTHLLIRHFYLIMHPLSALSLVAVTYACYLIMAEQRKHAIEMGSNETPFSLFELPHVWLFLLYAFFLMVLRWMAIDEPNHN
ncbi:unnamed protein product [Caenorhabditis bovis]|uniref:Uncharacterized protein n=1 Tax=Caenorhabditis bovis TaxID=2654633 RepID=A0A8S1FE18_9PELO|nr:unnamed protein product [Caenorhabditis bovis]